MTDERDEVEVENEVEAAPVSKQPVRDDSAQHHGRTVKVARKDHPQIAAAFDVLVEQRLEKRDGPKKEAEAIAEPAGPNVGGRPKNEDTGPVAEIKSSYAKHRRRLNKALKNTDEGSVAYGNLLRQSQLLDKEERAELVERGCVPKNLGMVTTTDWLWVSYMSQPEPKPTGMRNTCVRTVLEIMFQDVDNTPKQYRSNMKSLLDQFVRIEDEMSWEEFANEEEDPRAKEIIRSIWREAVRVVAQGEVEALDALEIKQGPATVDEIRQRRPTAEQMNEAETRISREAEEKRLAKIIADDPPIKGGMRAQLKSKEKRGDTDGRNVIDPIAGKALKRS